MSTVISPHPSACRALAFRERERAHFDRLARSTGEIWWGSRTPAGVRRLEWRATLLATWLETLGSADVLEIGCGTGALTGPLLERARNARLTACDISPHSVDVARERYVAFPNVRFRVADLFDDPFPPASFDAVVGNAILHHLHPGPFLPHLFRIVRPGGMIALFEPNMLNPQVALEKTVPFIGRWLQNTAGETAFFRRRLARQFRNLGFTDVQVEPFDFLHPAVPRALIRFVERAGRVLERIPLIRELSGSLIVRARRPGA